MRRDSAGTWIYSPTDVVRFYGSPFAAWMDRLAIERPGAVSPDPEAEEDRIVADLGLRHEEEHVAGLKAAGQDVEEVPRAANAFEQTRRALAAGRGVVVQGALRCLPFEGYADFLERVPGSSALGDYHYEVADTKLAASEKPSYLLQLCAYAEMLEAVQGRRPEHVHVILRGGVRRTFRTDDFFYVYRRVKDAFLGAMASWREAGRPEPDPGGDWGRWKTEAQRRLEAADSLALVAGVRVEQIRKLRAAGIETTAALAKTKVGRVRGIGIEVYDRLREQARLQIESRGRDVPLWRVVPPLTEEPRRGLALLPPPSPGDVYFDMEGYPLVDGGLEYLFGASTAGQGEADYIDWWGHDVAGERRAFEGFVRWVTARRRQDPSMHVYHYAAYERSALRRLMGRHGVCEDEVDSLLRDDVLVDVYAVVRQGLRAGTSSYSIKALEVLYGRRRATEVRTGGESIVAYHRWMESVEPREPAGSPLLAGIRAYNREDCLSTRDLVDWLRERQRETGIAWAGPQGEGPDTATAPSATAAAESERRAAMRALAESMLARIPEDAGEREKEADRWKVTEMLAHLVEFHRREAKPTWWSLFDRDGMDDDERVEDPTCLAGLERERRAPEPLKRSKGWWYRFDPDQETKVGEGSSCRVAGDIDLACTVEKMEEERGRALLKFGPQALDRLDDGQPPERMTLLLHDFVPAKAIEDSIASTSRAWSASAALRPAIRDLLLRKPPRVKGHRGGPLVRDREDAVDATVRIVRDLQESVLCVQGPPGTGKTYTAARAIAALISNGRRVGVTSNSHKAILNLLAECSKVIGSGFSCLKVTGGDEEDDGQFAADHPGTVLAASGSAAAQLGDHLLVGGTAWFFSRAEIADQFDVLFVDEAGQVSLANLVGMAPSAASLVLLGDPMQLPQPTQGSHPGESGLSALDYVLVGQPTVRPEFGIFLPLTQRLHPALCTFVSGAFYEDRLLPASTTAGRVVHRSSRDGTTDGSGRGGRDVVPLEAGILYVPVPHEGNAQRSEEEVEAVLELVQALLGRAVTDAKGQPAGLLALADIVIVAPYNLQVRALRARLPAGARAGTVDKFQGQQARISIVSLTASDADAASRGLEFVLDRRRLNVAISRAESISIVVASPTLTGARCRTVDQLRLLNTLCRVATAGQCSR